MKDTVLLNKPLGSGPLPVFSRAKRTGWQCGVAVLIVSAAAVVRLVLLQPVGTSRPFATFYPAVILAALYGGRRAGLLASLLSACLAEVIWMKPVGSLAVKDPVDALELGIFLLSGVMISWITEATLHAQAEARVAAAGNKKEKELHRLNRTLRALGDSAKAMNRATDETVYMQEVCKIVVDGCDNLMGWIGFAEEGAGKSIRIVAHAGFEAGYTETLKLTWADSELGRGPAGTAIRTGKPAVCRNMLTDPIFEPWREQAVKRGYASTLSLPLMADGRAFGVVGLYSRELDRFSEDEVKLLAQLADDLADGIATIRLRRALECSQRERDMTTAALRKSAEELQTMMDVAPVAIWVSHDPQCRKVVGNLTANRFYEAAQGENVSARPAAGQPVPPRRFFRDGRELTTAELPMQAAAAKNIDVPPAEMEVELPSGRRITIFGGASPLLDDAGTVRGCIGAFIDITERKRAEEENRKLTEETKLQSAELAASNKELEAFAYSVSHDLRAPLWSIDGFSKALSEDYGYKLDAEGRDNLQRIRAATQRMTMLINDLLGLSRVGRLEINRQNVDLSALVRAVAAGLRESDRSRKVEFLITDGLWVDADAQLLRMVLENLLGNAWKFSAKRELSTIEFGVMQQESEPAYFVRDNGAGFDPAFADRLFGVFQRLHKSSDFAGTGVGLATVQRIIHRHGGCVWAHSELDKGATFFFTL